LFALLYWHVLYPVHALIFSGLIRRLSEQASRLLLPIVGTILLTMNTHAADKFIFDFQTVTNPAAWQIVNDDVMGGVSTSDFRLTNGAAVFQGEVSLENNGGFASVRSSPVRENLSGCDAFVIRVRGDGRRYKFTVRTETGFAAPNYQAEFATKGGEWEEHCLSFKDFVPTFRGRVLTDSPPLSAAKIVSVGILISDKKSGPFRLELSWIKAATR
jgi:NADH dehydrogenase [ubiquinone] 1 alpha subcomplex assembly factor 1